MEAKEVVDKILNEAQEKAEAIRSEARLQADQHLREVDEELSRYREDTSRLAEEASKDQRERMMAGARMEARKQMLGKKTDLLTEVFDRARQRIREMDDNAYKDWVKDLIKKAAETGDEEIVVGPHEKRIDNELVKRVNRELGSGFKGNLRLAQDKAEHIEAGFVLRRGKIRVNASLAMMLDTLRDNIQGELARDLFES